MIQIELVARKKNILINLTYKQLQKSPFLCKQFDIIQTNYGSMNDHNVSKITFVLDKSMFYEPLLILARYLEEDILPQTIASKLHWSIAVATIFECHDLVEHIQRL
jgi:hypothetical protein